MMKSILQKTAMAAAVLVMTTGLAMAALSLDAAKSQGLVGEQQNGLIGAVSAASPDVATLINTTNAERLVRYRAVAEKNGTPLDQVQALAGQKLIQNAKPGEYIQNAGGGWQKK